PDNKPPILTWPHLTGKSRLLDGSISRFVVTRLSYRSLQEQPVLLTSFSGSVTWHDNRLSINNLKASSPSLGINGNASAGFGKPFLTADLDIALTQPLAEMNRFTLRIRHSNGTAREQLAVLIAISGSNERRKLLELGGDLGMERNAFNLRSFRLSSPARRGLINAEGSLSLAASKPVLLLQVKTSGLDLAPELNVPTDLSGVLKFTGTADSYHGDFTLANQAP